MSWLEGAKRRAEECVAQGPLVRGDDPWTVISHDAPRAYALLERAGGLLTQCFIACDRMGWNETAGLVHALLRDLEGKEETDAQDEKG